MIFVTVGTHEQPFDRLVQGIDRLKKEAQIPDDIFVQTGYSTYKPAFCQYKEFIPFAEMMRLMAEAEIVITHGGTGSIMLVLYHGKTPVVMPRQKKYHEHIDNHQVLFCQTMAAKNKIIAAYEPGDLVPALALYRQQAQPQLSQPHPYDPGTIPGLHCNEKAAAFAQKLNDICLQLMRKK